MKQASFENLGNSGSPAAFESHQIRLSIRLYYGVKDNGFSYFLLLYYNQVLGLPAGWVGSAILTALVVNASR